MTEFGKPAPMASGNVPPDTKTDSTSASANANANTTPQQQQQQHRGAVRNQQGTPMTSPSTPANSRSVVK